MSTVDKKALYGFIERAKNRETSLNKSQVRDLLISYIHNFFITHEVGKVRFLTLPTAWWTFEKAIRKRFFSFRTFRIRAMFTGCERDYNIFKLAGLRMPKSNKKMRYSIMEELNRTILTNGRDCVLVYSDIFDFMSVTDKKFNCLWIDTGTPIDRIAERLKLVSRVIMDGPSLVVITVLKGREAGPLPDGMDRIQFADSIMNKRGFERAQVWEYQDTSPMLQLTYQKLT